MKKNCDNGKLAEEGAENFSWNEDTEKEAVLTSTDELKKTTWYHVDSAMIPAKMGYWFDAAKRFSNIPFMVAFLNSIGLNKAEAGLIVGFRNLGALTGGPFWGLIADKSQAHRTLIWVLIVTSNLFIWSQVFISIPLASTASNKCPKPTLGRFANGNQTLNNNNSTDQQQMTADGSLDSSDTTKRELFFALLATNILFSFFEGSITSLIDSVVLRKIQLSATTRKRQYGKQKLFAPIGAATGSALASLVISIVPAVNVTCYVGAFSMYVVWSVLSIVSAFFLLRGVTFSRTDATRASGTTVKQKINKSNLRKTLKNTLLKFDVIIFLILAFIAGCLDAIFKNFFYVYVKELNATSLVLSMSLVMPHICSVFTFYFATWIIQFLGGTWRAIACAFCASCLRYLAMSFLQDPSYALLIAVLNGFGTPVFLVAGMHHIIEISPSNILTTMCIVFNLLLFSVGNIAGSSIGGYIYERFGGRIMYRTFSGLAGVSFVVACLYMVCSKKRSSERNEEKDHEEQDEIELRASERNEEMDQEEENEIELRASERNEEKDQEEEDEIELES